jgi:hypothetical protein
MSYVTDDLAAFYDVRNGDAELVTVQGTSAAALFDSASEVLLGEMLVRAPTLRLPATVAAAGGGACTVRGVSYTIRTVQALPPDGREHLLVLARS